LEAIDGEGDFVDGGNGTDVCLYDIGLDLVPACEYPNP
jgi:hypothetical protein